jgi:hypothetical protein
MNLMDLFLNNQQSAPVRQLADQFGLSEGQAASAVESLLPALMGGLQRNASTPQGLSSLLGALSGSQHQHYVDDPTSLSDPATVADGNAILGHILGSKDVSRSVAAQASQQTGIGTDLLKQMLPVVATLAMGYLSKQTSGGQVQQEGLFGMLSPMLDSNRDGSVVDDVLGMASRFFQK